MTHARWRVAGLSSLLSLAAACAPGPVDAGGEEISRLYDIFSAIAAVVFTITAGLILWSIIGYRRRRDDNALPKQTHSNVALEVVWFAIPQVIVVVLFLLSLGTLGAVDRDTPVDGAAAGDPLVVRTQGFQWGWRFTYLEEDVVVSGTAENNPEIVLPVQVPIVFELSSRDVIHSFYVPRFLTKRDVVPGLDNRLEITITKEGTYSGKCAEFCGLLHADMNFSIRAVGEDEFENWVEERRRDLESGLNRHG